MRKLLLLALLPFFTACEAQIKTYSSRLEYGLKGAVKEVNTYCCIANNDQIPKDTTGFISKFKMTFDEPGNAIETYNVYSPMRSGGITPTSRTIYSGKGKDISYKLHSALEEGKEKEAHYQYVWQDDYTYQIINTEDTTSRQIITLDKDFRIIKMVTEQDSFYAVDQRETIYKNGRIAKVITRSTAKMDGKTNNSISIWVVKEYDKHDNPRVLYIYDNAHEQQLKTVVFKTYTYY
ncbi:hypothetical protein [Edaphocola aurantiacus]|uniref:hypothetical protein n=1 Tax=Edaphocola aurantiacus TaxID=2601682 RepID=UPI001C9548A4|nr:hypothetical protein [Edaphocola aurantiacus]